MGGNDTITGNGNTQIAFYNATGGVTVDIQRRDGIGRCLGRLRYLQAVSTASRAPTSTTRSSAAAPPRPLSSSMDVRGNDTFDGRGGSDRADLRL